MGVGLRLRTTDAVSDSLLPVRNLRMQALLLENCFVVCSCFVWSRNPHHLACVDVNRNLALEGAVVELVTAAALVCGHRWVFHFPHFKIHTIHGHDADSSIWIVVNIRRQNELLFFQRGNHSNPAPEIFALDKRQPG
jgi:hypothetical protein